MTATTETTTGVGRVVRVTGPVVDVEFPDGHLPDIYNAVHIVSDGTGGSSKVDIVCEVEMAGEAAITDIDTPEALAAWRARSPA